MENELNYLEFAALVRKMRLAQIEYFKTRSVVMLYKAKALERAVDKYLFNS